MASSCVPATHLETSGAVLNREQLAILLHEPRVLGLAEMMNFPGVLMGDLDVLAKLDLFRGRVVDGHAPGLMGPDLQAYICAGIGSDHESYLLEEGRQKVAGGMMLMIREGTIAKNLTTLLPLVNDRNWDRFCFVSDDLHAEDLADRGHLDYMLRRAVEAGLDAITAIRLVTINPARYFGLRQRGALAPGCMADVVVLEDLAEFKVLEVYKEGRPVVGGQDGGFATGALEREGSQPLQAVELRVAPFAPEDLALRHPGGKARVIGIEPGQLVTRSLRLDVPAAAGRVQADLEHDILKLCVVERHHASGRIGVGLVQGLGLKAGALATSVAHDSHNIIAAGVDDLSLHRAVMRLKRMGGGMVVVRGEQVLAEVPLEVGGLMTQACFEDLVAGISVLKKAVMELGAATEEAFMHLSFLALPVIPELKLTDRGLVDVAQFKHVPLFIAEDRS